MKYHKNINSRLVVFLPLILLFLFITINTQAQFAPPAGQPESTAIAADSSIFIAWANHCTVERGLMDISNDTLGYASFGSDTDAIGKVNDAVVSLGDNGKATLEFIPPIINGSGFDFAVFENSFNDDFLELAFVEVSNDGLTWTRFPSVSNTQTQEQIETFGTIDATKINMLAGKYRAGYGTPFDLDVLKEINPELDLNNIAFVRIVDVVGSINENHATYDSEGKIINDPWPTPFESSGFDLEAVGVIYNLDYLGINEKNDFSADIYPNPANNFISIKTSSNCDISFYELNGKLIKTIISGKANKIDISDLPKGIIVTKISAEGKERILKLIHLN